MTYRLEIERRACKALARLNPQDQARIATAIDALAENARPAGCLLVRGSPKGTYRIRVGDHRLIYVVLDDERVVVVARIARRSESTYRAPR